MEPTITFQKLRTRILFTVVLGWVLPALSFKLFFVMTPLPAGFAERFVIPVGLIVYVLVAVGLACLVVDRRLLALDRIVFAARRDDAAARQALFKLVAAGALAMGLYLVLGGFLTMALAERDLLDTSARELLMISIAAVLLFVYISVPSYIYGFTLLGQRYGPMLSYLRFSSWRVKLLLAGPAVVFITVTSYTAYAFVYDQVHAEPLVVLAGLLLTYAVLVGLLANHAYKVALQPLTDYLAEDSIDADPAVLAPRSADETGLAVQALSDLLLELKGSEERFRHFAEAASDYFFEIDADLKFSYVSDRYEAITGLPPESILGLPAPSMSAVYDVADYDEHGSDLEKHQPYRNYTFAVTLLDGREIHLSVSAVPYFDENGVFQGYRGAGSDVTELVQAQQRLAEQERMLAHAQKMEAVGQLTGGIAHDFNNLLTVVMGNLEMMRLSGSVDAGGEYLDQAMSAAQKGATLVNRLLAYSRRQALQPRSVDLRALVDGMLDLMRRSLGENITIDVQAPDEPVVAYVDALQLENAILNLAINARDAMQNGGQLTLRLSNEAVTDKPGLRDGDYCRIEVEDTGVGMDATTRAMVFEPFFTTKEMGKGSGLGLSMVYGMVKQSNGEIDLESVPGQGTTFSIYLPATEQRGEDLGEAAELPGNFKADGEHILLVEDDGAVRELVIRQLRNLGYDVTAVADAESALRLDHDMFDLVVTDVLLSGAMDGIDMSTEIAKQRPQLPVLYVTGYTDRFEQLDPSRVLAKPFSIRDLAAKVATLLGRSAV